ncbi:MAG TPA: ABC transporter permease [Chryseosolibacter sp.]
MIKNYLLTTLRNISRRKGFTLLNVLGLSIGLAASLLILQYVKDELSYDDFHANAENIYRIQYDFYRDGERVFQCATAFNNVGTNMMKEYPEIENVCRLYLRYGGGVVRYGDISIKEDNVFTADQSFFQIFSYPVIKGDRNTVLKLPHTAVVEAETAKKIFGAEDPIGKRIRFGNDEDYEITGVVESPENSHLKFSFLFSYSTYQKFYPEMTVNDWENSWGWYDFYNYIQLRPGTDAKALEAKFPGFVKKYGPEGDTARTKFSLQHLPDIHLYSNLIQEARVNGNGNSVYFLMVIALFILVIAWVNYINLATARAVERAKEVGVRKAIGAGRIQLVWQFISEAFIVNLGAVFLALSLLGLTIPLFNSISGKFLSLSIFRDVKLWVVLGGLYVGGSLLSGLYPAFVLSRFRPVSVLKGALAASRQGLALRRILVVTQFIFSVGLIAGTLIVYQQLRFMQNRDLGIDIHQTLVIHAPGVVEDNSRYRSQYESFKNEMLRHPGVKSMAASSEIPGNLVYWTNGSARVGGGEHAARTIMYRIGVDYDFFSTFGNKVVAGRVFAPEFTADSNNVVLNRKAIEVLGFKSPDEAVGSLITIGNDTLMVIGVIENYHQEGLKNDFRQTAFHLSPQAQGYYSLKVETRDIGPLLADSKEKYSRIFPGNPFDYFFLDSFFNRQYKNDLQFGQVFGFFALLAIFVASLGLFGLASFTAAQRTKEIGIRKVLGSTVSDIFLLLSRDFLKLVVAANIIAVPLVWLLMEKWLDNFAFRIEIGLWVFIFAAVVTTLIALVTVSYQSIRAALTNPVDSLRYE